MELLSGWVTELSQWCRNYLTWFGLVFTAILLSFMSKPIVDFLRKRGFRRLHLGVRVVVLPVILILVFGVGLHFFPTWIAHMLNLFTNLTLAPVLMILVVLLGVFIER